MGVGHQASLAGIGRALDRRRGCRVKDELVNRVGKRQTPQLGLDPHANGDGHHAYCHSAFHVLGYRVAEKLKRGARKRHRAGAVQKPAALLDVKDAPGAGRTADVQAAGNDVVYPRVKLGVDRLSRVAQIAQDLVAIDRRELVVFDVGGQGRRLLLGNVAALAKRLVGNGRDLGLVHAVDVQAVNTVGRQVT